MGYRFNSIRTRAYWKYALVSEKSRQAFLACLGTSYLTLEILSFFNIINSRTLPSYSILLFLIVSLGYVIFTRRPIKKITYKVPNRDLSIEVRIGNLFEIDGQKVIGTNDTFDTDMSNNLISPKSIQGQFTNLYYQGNIRKLDDEINTALQGKNFSLSTNSIKKDKIYEMGTVVPLTIGREKFYLVSMSHLNTNGVAEADQANINTALEKLWEHISLKGDNETIVLPLLGTQYGRIRIPRKRMIAIHAESFLRASETRIFCKKLVIVIWEGDAEKFELNLYEIEDYLKHSLGMLS